MKPKRIVLLSKDPHVIRMFKSFRDEEHIVIVIKVITDAYKFFDEFSDSIDLIFIHSDSLDDDYFQLIQAIRKNPILIVNPYIIVIDNTGNNFALKVGADIVYDHLPDEKDIDLILQDAKFPLDLNTIVKHAVSMIQIKDGQTAQHCKNTAKISSVLASLYLQSCGKKDIHWHRNLKTAALLHDTGKILIPESILQKPSRLTDDEFKMMKNHTKLGSELFKKMLDIYPKSELFSTCAKVCLYHHEKFDGTGYPEGLKGDQIPLEARIVSIADVFDALISDRYYRNAHTFDKALQIMIEEEKGHFDPKLFDLFINNSDIFR